MKNIYAYTLCFFASMACASAADLTISDPDNKNGGTYDNFYFTGNGPLTNTTNSYYYINNGITVSSGVDAVIDAQNCLFLNNANNSAFVSGAGKDVSSLKFTGYHFSTRREPSPACHALSVNDITFNFYGSYNGSGNLATNGGHFRAGKFTITNSNVTLHEGILQIARPDTMTGDDASLVLDGSKFVLGEKLNNTALNIGVSTMPTANKYFELKNASTFESQAGTYGMTGFGIKASGGSTISVKALTNFKFLDLDGSTYKATGNTTGMSALTLKNSTLLTDGSMSVSGATPLSLSGTNHIKGTGSFSITNSDGSNEIKNTVTYATVAKLTMGLQSNGTATKFVIGEDVDGNKSKVEFSGGVQFNAGSIEIKGNSIVGKQGSTISRNSFNIASTKTSGSEQTIIEKGSELYISHSRINYAKIDGLIDMSGGRQSANGWDYAFALGTYSTKTSSQRGNVEIGENAKFNINATVATNFGLYGDISSSATVAALKSNANAKLMIYDDTTLTLNSTDAFAVGGAASQADSTFNFFDGSTSTLVVNKENNIGSFNFGSGATLTLELGENGSLVLGESSATSLAGTLVNDMITLSGDIYQKVKVFDLSDAQINQYFTSANGIFLQDAGNGAYWVNTVVPEPSEWAAIFGALALGFVAYRRRK